MKNYICDLFKYNDWANTQLLKSIELLPEKEEAIKLFSHMISAQNKWMNRITKEVNDTDHQWFGALLKTDELAEEWKKSIDKWVNLVAKKMNPIFMIW